MDGLEILHGALTVAKAGGLLPVDLIHWLGAMMDNPTAARSPARG